jgi:hypothetical protein
MIRYKAVGRKPKTEEQMQEGRNVSQKHDSVQASENQHTQGK